MVLAVSRLLSPKKAYTGNNSNRPMYTSIPTVNSGSALLGTKQDYRRFWKWFRESGELVATLQVPITDIIGDRPEWVAPDGSELGRNQRMKAQRFWRENRGKEVITAMLFDAFLTGDGFLWKAKPTQQEAKEFVAKYFAKNKLSTKSLDVKSVVDEVTKKVRKLDYVASSSMRIIHDEYDITGYEQVANGHSSTFKPDEIIHHRYLNIDGKVEGFSPAEALISEIYLLSLVKGNMISLMRNGGTPDKVFSLPKEIANSRNHKFLIEQLKKYKRVENWHGNLVFTGELKVEDLQGNPKDLEYKDLALYITSNLAFAYGIPITRIPYLIGSAASKGDSGGLSESGYWNRISDHQDTVEDLLNSQLFEEMGWHIKFPRRYKQDEVREATIMDVRADAITKQQELLRRNRKQLSAKKVIELLGYHETDLEDVEEMEIQDVVEDSPTNNNRLPSLDVEKEPDNRTRAQSKRNAATNRDVGAAATKP